MRANPSSSQQPDRLISRECAPLARMQHFKQSAPLSGGLLGAEMVAFYKKSVQRRQSKMAQLAECWAVLVPDCLSDHCALDSFSRGTLTVLVDSASHLYELKQLLLAGVQDQLLLAGRTTGLRKITLRSGSPRPLGEPMDRRNV